MNITQWHLEYLERATYTAPIQVAPTKARSLYSRTCHASQPKRVYTCIYNIYTCELHAPTQKLYNESNQRHGWQHRNRWGHTQHLSRLPPLRLDHCIAAHVMPVSHNVYIQHIHVVWAACPYYTTLYTLCIYGGHTQPAPWTVTPKLWGQPYRWTRWG